MTLQLIEGYDHMSTPAKFAAKGWTETRVTNSGGGSSASSSAMATGRVAGTAYNYNSGAPGGNGGNSINFVKTLPATLTQFVVGFAFQMSSLPLTASGEIFSIRVGTTRTVRIYITTTGHFAVLNSGLTVIATGTYTYVPGTWVYLEFKVVINGASGSVASHVNGVADIGTTTGNFGSTAVDSIGPSTTAPGLSTGGNTPWGATAISFYWDDMYVVNTAASPNNDYLGDVAVETIYPSADGAHTQWTPSSGTNHYDRVNEHSGTFPDDDTTYVSDANVGDRDSYAFDNLSSLAGTVLGLQTNLHARKDDAGTRQLAAVARPASTDRDGATVTLTTSYVVYSEIREVNPDTSAAWSISEVNATEFGVKVVA